MKTYIGIKEVKAEPMKKGAAEEHLGRSVGGEHGPDEDGYLVEYDGGYQAWSPKSVFDAAYMHFGVEVGHDEVDAFITQTESFKSTEDSVIAKVFTVSGFSMAEHTSGSGDLNKLTMYALARIRDRLYEHLKFVVVWARHGIMAGAAEVAKKDVGFKKAIRSKDDWICAVAQWDATESGFEKYMNSIIDGSKILTDGSWEISPGHTVKFNRGVIEIKYGIKAVRDQSIGEGNGYWFVFDGRRLSMVSETIFRRDYVLVEDK